MKNMVDIWANYVYKGGEHSGSSPLVDVAQYYIERDWLGVSFFSCIGSWFTNIICYCFIIFVVHIIWITHGKTYITRPRNKYFFFMQTVTSPTCLMSGD